MVALIKIERTVVPRSCNGLESSGFFFFFAVDVNGFFGWMYHCFILRHLRLSC